MGSQKTHQKQRGKMRRNLRARGYSEAAIDVIVAAKAQEQARARRDNVARPAPPPPPPPKRHAGTWVSVDKKAEARAAEIARQRDIDAYEARRAAEEEDTYRRLSPDDSRYRPAPPDPLTTGAARVTGVAATVVKRGTTITRTEHERMEHD